MTQSACQKGLHVLFMSLLSHFYKHRLRTPVARANELLYQFRIGFMFAEGTELTFPEHISGDASIRKKASKLALEPVSVLSPRISIMNYKLRNTLPSYMCSIVEAISQF